jgi:S-(hydroxymethyl)glutathione dehydrogenase/alcohol dehydrogenase
MMAVILQERTLKGCWYGSADIHRDVPRMVELYRQGTLYLDELVGRRIGLDDVNDAFTLMRRGEAGRAVIVY